MKPEFECGDCIKRNRRDERGCEKDAPFAYWTDINGENRKRCPRRPIFEDPNWYNRIITAYNQYKAGFLPHSGGLLEQAALYPFIMICVDEVVSECDRIEMEKTKTKSNTPGSVNVLERK
jgi:hypothetical protein